MTDAPQSDSPTETTSSIEPREVVLLSSPLRLEIVNCLEASDSMTTSEIASELGVPSDGLYYHLRILVEGGLVEKRTQRIHGKRTAVFRSLLAGRKIRYDTREPDNSEALRGFVGTVLRVAERDFAKALDSGLAEEEGDARDLWIARLRAWLTRDDRIRLNRLLEEIAELFERPRRPEADKLVTLSYMVAPIDPRPVRRRPSGEDTDDEIERG